MTTNQETVAPPPDAPIKTGKRPRGRPRKVKKRTRGVEVTIPMAPECDGPHVSRRIDINRLTLRQAETLRRIFLALHESHATLSTGRHVDTGTDAVRWLLDTIGDAET